MAKKDKRKFLRFGAHHLIKYRVAERKQKEDYHPFVRNISANGVLFYTEEYIPKDSIVDVEINFPAYPHPIKARCRVTRVNPLKIVGGFEIGTEFVDIDKATQEFINKKITRVYKKKIGGEPVRTLATILFLLGAISILAALALKIMTNLVIPERPVTWLIIANTCLLFSIALSFLAAQK